MFKIQAMHITTFENSFYQRQILITNYKPSNVSYPVLG